ncbi:glycosyl transferase group 1 [Desulfurobacterium thermolithotrophum DSM 11699]|uniref:Glycosyl transferase group 1 n=2 Tax=Desulfurobacterium thermolithotrophum TaxID=64160 RepID=F0S2U2_DESTD|nr:glycosyl transferase group 1 [Desulfurobacterium thermolithotrophum DSM 11699]
MKKVALLVRSASFGGIERLVIDLFKYMKEHVKEIEPYLIVFCREGGFLKELEEEKNVYFLSSKKKLKTTNFDIYLKLRKLLKELEVDILHFHSYPVDFIGVIASLGLRVKRIAHIHNFHFIGGEKRIKKYRFISKYIDSFIYVSKAVMESVDPLYNAYCPNKKVLYNFIVPERIETFLKKEKMTRKELGIPEDGVVFCFVGRLTDNKNILNLIKAMSYLKERKNLYLLIVGSGKLEKNAKELAKNLQLRNIVFAGASYNPFKYLKVSNVFILPSKVEGLPLSHLEAMYLGLPSLISENVPSKEIPSKEIAYEASFISGISPESIAKGIENLYICKDIRDTLAVKAKEVIQNFIIDRYFEKLYEIYTRL